MEIAFVIYIFTAQSAGDGVRLIHFTWLWISYGNNSRWMIWSKRTVVVVIVGSHEKVENKNIYAILLNSSF